VPREIRGQRYRQLATRAHIQTEPLLGGPARDGPAQEGLARVVHRGFGRVVVAEGREPGTWPHPPVGLINHISRSPLLLREPPQRHSPERDLAVLLPARRRGPDLR